MRVVALISGGKDSCFNMMQCVAAGHDIVALANLRPSSNDEIDSYMYQTVGHDAIDLYAESMGLPLFRRNIAGNALMQSKEYLPTPGDEVEDLYCLLRDIKKEVEYDGISVGAILSDYQRTRVENVCTRLGCMCLAYLWRRDQCDLLQDMIDCKINAIIIKTASLGLLPDVHLGQSISEMQQHLLQSKEKYGINVCGEGGEYETFTLDCPLFRQSIILDEYEKVIHSNDAFAPVGYLKLKSVHLEDKNSHSISANQRERLAGIPIKAPLEYLTDLVECTKPNCCDGHTELCVCTDAMNNQTNPEPDKLEVKNCGTEDSETSCEGSNLEDDRITNSFVDRESLPSSFNFRVTMNNGGWCWIMGLSPLCCGDIHNVNKLYSVLTTLKHELEKREMTLKDVVAICMYVSNLDDYVDYNREYIKFFDIQPPIRVCVEASLSSESPIVLNAVAFKSQNESTRNCMHIQGISHWAPANIGPYSQAIWIGDIIYVAGQIGLVPGSMTLVPGGAKKECRLALRSLNRILKAADSKVELRDVVQGICYLTSIDYIEECRKEWEKLTTNGIVEYIVVPRLPKNSQVEWQIWAHKHNTAFEYEETGCYVGQNVKVRLYRRWNYENRVSAIVCRASIGSENSTFGFTEMTELVEYALSKLLRDADKSLECSLRVFYKTSSVNSSEIFDILDNKCSKFAIAFTIVPVCSFGNPQALVSLCGVRH